MNRDVFEQESTQNDEAMCRNAELQLNLENETWQRSRLEEDRLRNGGKTRD